MITDEDGKTYTIDQGIKDEPAVVGCADGQREAFVDESAPRPSEGVLALVGLAGHWAGSGTFSCSAQAAKKIAIASSTPGSVSMIAFTPVPPVIRMSP